MDIKLIIYIAFGLILVLFLAPAVIKQYYLSKTKGKVLVRVVNNAEDEIEHLVNVEGLTTDKIKGKDRAYVVHPVKYSEKNKPVSGSTFNVWYPSGLPRSFQVRLRGMAVSEGNPVAKNFYGADEDMLLTDGDVALIKEEAHAKVAIASADDSKDMLTELAKHKKAINPTVLWIMLGIIIALSVVGIFLNMQGGIPSIDTGWF